MEEVMIQQPYSLHTLSHAYCQNLMCRFWGDNETNLRIPRANIGETNNINYQKQSTLNSQSGIGAISIANINGVILNTGSRTKEEFFDHEYRSTINPINSPLLTPSYLPRLETSYCKNYQCCGKVLSNLHELLRHYEGVHVNDLGENLLNYKYEHKLCTSPTLSASQDSRENLSSLPTAGAMKEYSSSSGYGMDVLYPGSNYSDEVVSTDAVFLTSDSMESSSPITPDFLPYYSPQRVLWDGSDFELEINLGYEKLDIGDSFLMAKNNNSKLEENLNNQCLKDQNNCISNPARNLYMFDREGEDKPFKCPVIGCPKAYKNLNGLKYHRLHGHLGQMLKKNLDGTFSIIDPKSNKPYPEQCADLELVYQKERPYHCDICGKRYKNLNGLKYHRGHSHC